MKTCTLPLQLGQGDVAVGSDTPSPVAPQMVYRVPPASTLQIETSCFL